MSLYLTTTVADVIATVERNAAGRKDLIARGQEWGTERGFDTIMMNGHAGSVWVAGLPRQPEGFGQWTKPKNGSSKPFATNTAEINALKALEFKGESVPGLHDVLYSDSDHDGRRYLMYPTPFISLGAAWVAYPHQPAAEERAKIGEQWSECLASKFYAAKEALG